MLITQISDHVKAAIKRLMSQYRDLNPQYFLPLSSDNSILPVSGISMLVAVFANEIQNLENVGFDVNNERLFYNGTTFPAQGAQLDGIGALVGIGRNGLNDAEYLIFIIAKIAENFSDGTIPAIGNIVSLLFETQIFNFFEMFPAEIDLQIPDTSPLDPALYGAVAGIIQASLGAGIGLGSIVVYDATNPFEFGDALAAPAFTNGFGDVNDASVGGEFASVVYNNPGA
jgi:hypothetical protein